MQKINFPAKKIAVDSLWITPNTIEINGISFYDTLSCKIVNYNAGVFDIEGESQNITPFSKNCYLHGISKLTSVDSCDGKGKYSVQLTARGIINYLTADYKVRIKIKLGKDYIWEEVESTMNWERLETYKL